MANLCELTFRAEFDFDWFLKGEVTRLEATKELLGRGGRQVTEYLEQNCYFLSPEVPNALIEENIKSMPIVWRGLTSYVDWRVARGLGLTPAALRDIREALENHNQLCQEYGQILKELRSSSIRKLKWLSVRNRLVEVQKEVAAGIYRLRKKRDALKAEHSEIESGELKIEDLREQMRRNQITDLDYLTEYKTAWAAKQHCDKLKRLTDKLEHRCNQLEAKACQSCPSCQAGLRAYSNDENASDSD